jgi:hypothetical protein
MELKEPSIWAFIAAFRGHWFAAMSGGFSVPFAFASALAGDKYVQSVLLVLAFCGAWVAAYRIWKVERERALGRNKRKQQLLDDISSLREQLGKMRIDIEHDISSRTFDEKGWQGRFDDQQNEIASKIEQFSSKAEAIAYRHRGNIQRPINTNMGGFLNHQLVDVCIHDLDYLRQFVLAYSRSK